MQCGGIVLCGGRSSRMGSDKAMLPFGGEAMLQRVVRQMRSVVEPVAVVAALDQRLPDLPDDVVVVRDRQQGRGPLEGIGAGLAALDGRVGAVYASACDVPLLRPEFIQMVIALIGTYQIAVPTLDGREQPLAAVYRSCVLEHIESLLAMDQLALHRLCQRLPTLRIPADDLRDVDPDLDSLLNVNDPQQYQRALAKAGLV